jgi:hypothetical protein
MGHRRERSRKWREILPEIPNFWAPNMTPCEIKAAREKYNYVPARLIRAGDYVAADLTWKSLKLIMNVPAGWDVEHQQTRSQYSSYELDEFHRSLLQSENEEDLIHGLLSVVFWGFSSGVDGRLNTPRALSRARAIVFGRKNAPPQSAGEIIVHIKHSRELLNASKIAEALLEAEQIKYLQMSFASKLIAFMNPNATAVYDAVISLRLEKETDPELRTLFVSTNMPTSKSAKISQANAYAAWCRWCAKKAGDLNARGAKWRDWNGTANSWRAVDIERAFFALGR